MSIRFVSPVHSVQLELRKLVPMCLEALPRMVVADQGLFCYRERRVGSDLQAEGVSVRYTAITLIGLSTAQKNGLDLPATLEVKRFATRLSQERQVDLGDLGLIVWALSLSEPDLTSKMAVHLLTRLENSPVAPKALDTMQLAWVLIGLSKAYQADATLPKLKRWASRAAKVLSSAFNPATGLFYRFPEGHRSPMRWIASFALEIYPVYALATYAEVFGRKEVLTVARACADRLCALQLPDGGWPWMYDVRTGQVVDPYPVYSVHQDGMAPMALIKLGHVSGRDYSAAIGRGLAWLFGRNALGMDMVDEERQTIWRALEVARLFGLQPRLALNAASALVLGRGRIKVAPLRLVAECRPYHLGWLLLAAFDQ